MYGFSGGKVANEVMDSRWRTAFWLAILLPTIVLSQEIASSNLVPDLQAAIEAQQAGEEVTEDVGAKIIKEAPIGVLPSGTGDVATTGEYNFPTRHQVTRICGL